MCALILLIVKIKNVAKMISVFFSNNVLLFYTSEHIKDAPLYSIKQNQNLSDTYQNRNLKKIK